MNQKKRRRVLAATLLAAALASATLAAETFENSIGMKLVRIPAGSFVMGSAEGGDFDERPTHPVHISRPFFMSVTEVNNAQYEQFDPAHRLWRGKQGCSKEDGEAVVFVSWNDAQRFCEWLSRKEGKAYRLPTEAEWEYACRAGTATAFWTGDHLPEDHHRNQWSVTDNTRHKDQALRKLKGKVDVSLRVGVMPANPWGLCEMHGNVEEWVQDWYAPCDGESGTDPVGPADGIFKVTRGGSHNTALQYLRSANRSATVPEDKHWLIGFRVVQSLLPDTKPRPAVLPTMNDPSVTPGATKWSEPANQPVFHGPIPFVRPDEAHPLLSQLPHHHCPTITWCANGDLLAVWFNTISEIGREMVIVSSRLRRRVDGKWADQWDTARLFFGPADRNTTGSCLFNDGQGRLYFFNAVGDSGHHHDQCMVMSISEDSGRTWIRPRVITDLMRRHKYTPMASAFADANGTIILAMDFAPLGHSANEAGSGVFISRDRGETWIDQISGKSKPVVAAGTTDGLAAGFHINVVRLKDSRLLAMTRGGSINGNITQSYSSDEGRTWTYRESSFPEIGAGQRLVLLRLREGPLFLASFGRNMSLRDAAGRSRKVSGLFGALSFDEGETWPVRRLITDDGAPRELDGGGNTGKFTLSPSSAEPRGYLAGTQTPDNAIHLISSRLHYTFNLAWVKQPMAAPPTQQQRK